MEIGYPQKPMAFYEVNQAVISPMLKSALISTIRAHSRAIWFSQGAGLEQIIVFRYISTKLQLAGIFTKPRRDSYQASSHESVKAFNQDQEASKKTRIPPHPRRVCSDYMVIGIIGKCYAYFLLYVYVVILYFYTLWKKKEYFPTHDLMSQQLY